MPTSFALSIGFPPPKFNHPEYEVNSLLQGKRFVNRGAPREVKSLCALKLGGQEEGNWLENHVPRKVWRIQTKADQYALCPGNSITAHAWGNDPCRGYEEKNHLTHRLK